MALIQLTRLILATTLLKITVSQCFGRIGHCNGAGGGGSISRAYLPVVLADQFPPHFDISSWNPSRSTTTDACSANDPGQSSSQAVLSNIDLNALLQLVKILEADKTACATKGIDVDKLLETLVKALVYTTTHTVETSMNRCNTPAPNDVNSLGLLGQNGLVDKLLSAILGLSGKVNLGETQTTNNKDKENVRPELDGVGSVLGGVTKTLGGVGGVVSGVGGLVSDVGDALDDGSSQTSNKGLLGGVAGNDGLVGGLLYTVSGTLNEVGGLVNGVDGTQTTNNKDKENVRPALDGVGGILDGVTKTLGGVGGVVSGVGGVVSDVGDALDDGSPRTVNKGLLDGVTGNDGLVGGLLDTVGGILDNGSTNKTS